MKRQEAPKQMGRRHTALITVPFLLLTSSCSIYTNFIESKVCQQYKDGNHPILGNHPDISIEDDFGKDSGMNEFAESVQTKCAKYIDLP